MLIIRDAQMAALAAERRRRFVPRACEILGELWPRKCARLQARGALEAYVAAGVDRAVAHGFVSERDVMRFMNLMMALGPRFDRDQPWAARVLAEPALPAAAKIDLLQRMAAAQLRGATERP